MANISAKKLVIKNFVKKTDGKPVVDLPKPLVPIKEPKAKTAVPGKRNIGRPTKMTDDVVRKLEEAFSWGCTDLEACLHAGISRQTLYDYQEVNPEFIERKEELKENPVLLARQTVVANMRNQPKVAMEFLRHKKRDEFAVRVENTGKDGGPMAHKLADEEKEKINEALGLKE